MRSGALLASLVVVTAGCAVSRDLDQEPPDAYQDVTVTNAADERATLVLDCPLNPDVTCFAQHTIGGAESMNLTAPDLDGVWLHVEYDGCEVFHFPLYEELNGDNEAVISNPCSVAAPSTATEEADTPQWLADALEGLDEASNQDPQWVGSTFWGSSTWSEWGADGALITYVDQPFTLRIDASTSADRPWACETYADELAEQDPLDESMAFLDRLEESALQGNFREVLDTVGDGPGPFYPEFVPADCSLRLSTSLGYTPGDNPIVVSEDRIDAGLMGQALPAGGVLLPVAISGTPGFCQQGSDIRLERVGTIAETGGSVIRGNWVEWEDCSAGPTRAPGDPTPHGPVEGVRCVTNVLKWDVEFYSTDPADHDRFLRSDQELPTGETITPLDHETYTSCQLSTKGTFYAFSFPPGEASLPGGVTADQVRQVVHAYGLARSGAVPDDAAELGFFEVMAEIRAQALTWIVRNMPVYDADEGTWSSFESYAIDLGHRTGVPPDSRLAQDPVGTAMDMAFRDATVDDMVGWIGLERP